MHVEDSPAMMMLLYDSFCKLFCKKKKKKSPLQERTIFTLASVPIMDFL